MTKTPPSCCFKKSGVLIYAWLLFDLQFALEPCIWNIAHKAVMNNEKTPPSYSKKSVTKYLFI